MGEAGHRLPRKGQPGGISARVGRMGDSIAEELVQLFRGINASLTVKLSHLLGFVFRNKNASSIGAAAGLAIALWWTWKCWRIPGARPHPRVDKRDGADAASASATRAPAGASMDSGPGALSTAVATSITQATQRGGPAEGRVSETDELSVAQIVRRQLNGSRKMTCQLLGVILEEIEPGEGVVLQHGDGEDVFRAAAGAGLACGHVEGHQCGVGAVRSAPAACVGRRSFTDRAERVRGGVGGAVFFGCFL